MVRRKNKKSAPERVRTVEFPQADSCFTIAIIGGGASGIAAACAIGRAAQISYEDVRVVIVERARRIGSSILRSGNGRCNFSHEDMRPDLFNRPVFVEQAFASLEAAFNEAQLDGAYGQISDNANYNAVLRWFNSLGLVWTESSQNAGALYPFSNKATSVLEVLTTELDRCGVERYCGIEVASIEKQGSRFSLLLNDALAEEAPDSCVFTADMVIYAAGGASCPTISEEPPCPDGVLAELEWIPPVPVLGPLETDTSLLKNLDGVRMKARLSCPEKGFAEEGEVLFRTYGISGIVVFNASRFAEPGDTILLDLAPEWSFTELEDILFERSRLQSWRKDSPQTYGDLLQGFFLPEVAEAIIRACNQELLNAAQGLDSPVTATGITQLVASVKAFALRATGHGSADQSQLSRGGVHVESIDPATMQTRLTLGLFVTGEALDVDGPCGGYNLHWAWASGLLAGLAAVEERALSRMLHSSTFLQSEE